MLTMSRLGAARGSAAARHTFAWFLTDPNGFTRAVVRTVAAIMKERWQAARQQRLDVLPRIHRGWTYAGLRADYDKIAHHARYVPARVPGCPRGLGSGPRNA
jgi:hypothetical protein